MATDAGTPTAEYIAMLREDLSHGKWKGSHLFNYRGNYRMPSTKKLYAEEKTFVAVGLAICDLVFYSKAAFEGFSPIIIKVLQRMSAGKHPVVHCVDNDLRVDEDFEDSYDSLTQLSLVGTLSKEEKTNLEIEAARLHLSVPEDVGPRMLLKLQEELAQNFFINSRLDQLWDLHDGMRLGGLNCYFKLYPDMWNTVFPTVGDLKISASDLMNKIVFVEVLGRLLGDQDDRPMTNAEIVVTQYITEIAGDVERTKRFLMGGTGYDVMTLGKIQVSERQLDRQIFRSCGGKLESPCDITPEGFANCFIGTLEFNQS